MATIGNGEIIIHVNGEAIGCSTYFEQVNSWQSSMKRFLKKPRTIEKFNHSVSVLVKSYLEGTLNHRLCTACAVGNLVADACNLKMKPIESLPMQSKTSPYPIEIAFDCNSYDDGTIPTWWNALQAHRGKLGTVPDPQLVKVGYNVYEIDAIESAFEKADHGANQDEWNFNGLCAVFDVLAKIHGVELEENESAKKLLVRA